MGYTLDGRLATVLTALGRSAGDDVLARLPELLAATGPDAAEVVAPGAGEVPLRCGSEVVRTLRLPPGAPLGSWLLFAAGVSALLEMGAGQARAERLHRLTEQLAGQGEDLDLMRRILEGVVTEFGLRGAQGLRDRHGTLHPESCWRVGDPGPLPEWSADERAALRGGHPTVREDGLLLPLAGRWRPRLAMWFTAPPGRAWSPHDLDLLGAMAHAAGLEFERVQLTRHMAALLRLQENLLALEAEAAYRPLLQEALRIIPGAETGSLLVREGDVFRYRAAIVHDMTELRDVTFTLEDVRDRWYGLGLDAWTAGVPRVLVQPGQALNGTGHTRAGVWVDDLLPSVYGISANVGVPVLYRGEVYAFLNIDARHDPHAFGGDSVEVARTFALHAAALLRETAQRARIEEAARTDVLTGLPNRRAFSESLARQVAAARRQGSALSLLVLDASNFKAINDRLGHVAGDRALRQIGAAVTGVLRAGDEVFRWGGDEFAVLLPRTAAPEAETVAGQIHAALRGQRVGGLPLHVTVGVAGTRPGELPDGDGLLRRADAAMYRAKREEQRCAPAVLTAVPAAAP
ncbi:sensor domain-containing diguanylate cyclase [Deinococcus sp. MIMF12]|uniref:Sensor domain-containing diguanylate cyclase n=1 Tax=Deinococcus rhizophilus TaxID=3049544 RepID=A0ABT7JJY4_9DEIO|nr:sensor domain-containing diguanylate cyclase [Deinococcus rhizophilus]MDL2344795.1 sensor domain-containing diguanylate cyclase [Deinococcus rhizophilus]